MGVIQEDRFDAPRPDVEVTGYGAEYVKAATETPLVDVPVPAAGDVASVEDAAAADVAVPADVVSVAGVKKEDAKPRKKVGRQRKTTK